ncbi:UNVERIFIED_CONTAM: hypothetical protein HDU68_006912 [Siphonaria sp. JEL0065]|nr:hypothetical protein HDU68_006912 [Siphonaria sp. JEL0065]
MDGDMFFLRKSPLELFRLVDDHKKTGSTRPFFGAVKDWPGGADYETGQFDSALMVFEPTRKEYNGLLETIPTSLGFGDQRVLTKYYNSEGERPFYVIPHHYHTSRLLQRTSDEIKAAVGFHFKFLTIKLDTDHTKGLFEEWAKEMQQLRRIQLEALADGRLVPIVPVVPNSFDEWQEIRKRESTIYDTVALVSFGEVDESERRNRQELAIHFQQSVSLSATPSTSGSIANTLALVATTLEKYEWVWILSNSASVKVATILSIALDDLGMNGPTKPKIIGFNDCKDGKRVNSASVVVHKSSLEKLKQHLTKVGKTEMENQVWIKLVAQFEASERKTLESTSLYSVHGACNSFFHV